MQAWCLLAALQIYRREWTATLLTYVTLIWFASQLYVTFFNAFKNLKNLKFLSVIFS